MRQALGGVATPVLIGVAALGRSWSMSGTMEEQKQDASVAVDHGAGGKKGSIDCLDRSRRSMQVRKGRSYEKSMTYGAHW